MAFVGGGAAEARAITFSFGLYEGKAGTLTKKDEIARLAKAVGSAALLAVGGTKRKEAQTQAAAAALDVSAKITLKIRPQIIGSFSPTDRDRPETQGGENAKIIWRYAKAILQEVYDQV